MSIVPIEIICAELNLARFEVERFVEAGVLAVEDDSSFDLGWNRLAHRAWKLREPAVIETLRREAASMVESYRVRVEILSRSPSAGPEARARLVALGQDALRHARLLAAVTHGPDRDRHQHHAQEIRAALVALACPLAAE